MFDVCVHYSLIIAVRAAEDVYIKGQRFRMLDSSVQCSCYKTISSYTNISRNNMPTFGSSIMYMNSASDAPRGDLMVTTVYGTYQLNAFKDLRIKMIAFNCEGSEDIA